MSPLPKEHHEAAKKLAEQETDMMPKPKTLNPDRPFAAEVVIPSTPPEAQPPPGENPQSIPKTIDLELTPKFYQLMKQKMLAKHNALVRSHVETYFEWLQTLNPEDVVDAIETNTTLREAYRKAPFKWRLAIGTARAFLKSSKKYAAQFRSVVDLELALVTLKFENPTAYAAIQQYGDRGINYLKQSLKDALVIFGVEKEEPKAA